MQLPGLIVFVHGVNSEGEWYDYAEASFVMA
ncbi:T6SS effector phospholipase Tle3 domain-containing protein [Pantoea sp. C2G6]